MSRNWFSWFKANRKDISDSNSNQKQKTSAQQQQQQKTYQHKTAKENRPFCSDEKPFHVVLIDLKKAVDYNIIHCIEKPLMDQDFKYVAISYRWGEVQETTVNTGVGYLATITSFDFDDFFDLCRMITQEVDLQSMEYIWVDAICVNQTNPNERESTIYHMTDIYQRANYILAVPDLHLRYLESSSANNRHITYGSFRYRKYIYRLLVHDRSSSSSSIHNLFDDHDQQLFLDNCGVPKGNHRLRRLLLTNHHTEHFETGLVTGLQRNSDDHQDAASQHIYKTAITTARTPRPSSSSSSSSIKVNNNKNSNTTMDDQEWSHIIPERYQQVRQSVVFMSDLVIDWSTRAWVVSEYHIAKNKSHRMKYWFIQLGDVFDISEERSFFMFDFDAAAAAAASCDDRALDQHPNKSATHYYYWDNIYKTFHSTMRQQLNEQTFLKKMLNTKASRHEDRFHAILPSTKYSHILDKKDIVDHWHTITTLLAVKLELFMWMTTRDKLELLFLTGQSDKTCQVLPTFATTNLDWTKLEYHQTLMAAFDKMEEDPDFPGSNFDLTNPSTIQLLKDNNNNSFNWKLTIKPKKYYRFLSKQLFDRFYTKDFLFLKLLALNFIGGGDDDDDDTKNDDQDYDVIMIQNVNKHHAEDDRKRVEPQHVSLVGYRTKNKWVLVNDDFLWYNMNDIINSDEDWEVCQCDENSPGFDIY